MRNSVNKPNKFIYGLANMVLSSFFKVFYSLSVDKSKLKGLEPPYVVVVNHISNIDFLITGVAMYPVHMNFVAGALYFRMKSIAWLLKYMGVVSKEQFVPDMQSIKDMLRVIKQDGVLAIYPSGQSSFSGGGTYINEGIAPLIKKLNVPVVNVHISGAHIAFPKWNMSRFRKSKIEVEISQIISKEQMGELSQEEIYRVVNDALGFDDYSWQKNALVAARKPRCAEGIDKVLFICPKCENEFIMRASKNRLYCDKCDNSALMDEYGLLGPSSKESKIFETPTEWNKWQMDRYKKELDDNFAYSEGGYLLKCDRKGRFVRAGEGALSLSTKNMIYEGTYLDNDAMFDINNSLNAILDLSANLIAAAKPVFFPLSVVVRTRQ